MYTYRQFMKNPAKRERLKAFCLKYHFNFFILVLALFILNGLVYEITAIVPFIENHHLYMAIDDAIPLIPEFCFFYTTFYATPFVFLYALSFYDKKKFDAIFIDGCVTVVICLVVYLIWNVQMIRPEHEVEAYWFFDGSIHNPHEFFLALVHFQYIVDPMARNGIPSLHALFACLVFLTGCPLSKKEKHVPIALRITAMVFGLGIACSTFFVKQHYFIDAVIGFGLAFVAYFPCKPLVKKIINENPDSEVIKLLTLDKDDYEGKQA